MGGVQKITAALGGVAEGALVVTATLPLWAVPLLKLAVIGAILELTRAAFIEACPPMASASIFVALIVNSALIAVSELVDVISIITTAIAALTGDLHAPTFVLYTVSPAEIQLFLTETPIDCMAYDSVAAIMGGVAKLAANDALCPQLRYIYPIPWLRSLALNTVGWMSFDPNPDANNCVGEPIPSVCIGIGIGYLVLEVLLPMVIVALTLPLLLPVLSVILIAATEILRAAARLIQAL